MFSIRKLHLKPLAALALATCLAASAQQQTPSLATLRQTFAQPPNDARPMVRWWWFGPAVTKPEIAREIDAMHAAGIGGFELASVYPLSLDDPAKGIHNLTYAGPEHVEMLQFAADHGRSLGMRVDLTLGSGWPFGGPQIPLNLAAGRLKIVAVPLGTPNAVLPKVAEGDSFIAAFTAQGTPQHYDAVHAQRLPGITMPTALAGGGQGTVELFFLFSHTRQQVKRAAVGGEGFVLDHMSKAAIEQHQRTVGDALLKAFPTRPPYAIFSDSLEVYGSDWTPTLPEEFKRRRGYDLIAHLPELAQGGTPEADDVRHDWGVTLSDLVRDNYLAPMAQYARAHGTLFRSQTYGEPAATLHDETVPQLPEGEGPQWRSFSFTRWASSANHVYGNNVTSAETFTWLHSPAFRATPLDMKAEADRMFLEGVNQIIEHGFPYSAPGVAEPGWSLYAAAALNDHNPWWPVMPSVAAYLHRVSWALRQGQPANDVAILLPEADAQARFHPGQVTVTGEMRNFVTEELMGAILDAGHNIDYTDVDAAEAKGLHHPLVVVPSSDRMPLTGVHVLERYVANGGKLVFIGKTPTRATGLADAKDTPAVQQGIAALLAKSTHVDSIADLRATLPRLLAADFDTAPAQGKVGFLHRKLADADLYFIANTANEPVTLPVAVHASHKPVEWWDPETGKTSAFIPGEPLTLAPYGSRILVCADHTSAKPVPEPTPENRPAVILSDWSAAFPGSASSTPQPPVDHVSDTLWTAADATKFYSGEARYTTHFTAPKLTPGEHLILRFPPPQPLPDPHAKNGMSALLDPPIREAAIVELNGKPVGSLWHAPYVLDLGSGIRPGENTLTLRIFNTAINALAGQPPRDYSALKAKYGDRFQMQDMDNLQPIPSGFRGPVELEFSKEGQR